MKDLSCYILRNAMKALPLAGDYFANKGYEPRFVQIPTQLQEDRIKEARSVHEPVRDGEEIRLMFIVERSVVTEGGHTKCYDWVLKSYERIAIR